MTPKVFRTLYDLEQREHRCNTQESVIVATWLLVYSSDDLMVCSILASRGTEKSSPRTRLYGKEILGSQIWGCAEILQCRSDVYGGHAGLRWTTVSCMVADMDHRPSQLFFWKSQNRLVATTTTYSTTMRNDRFSKNFMWT